MSVSVLLVDDHELVLEGLIALLEREEDIGVVGIARNGQEAIALVTKLDPDVVVLDYQLPDTDGAHICRKLAEGSARSRVVMLSGFVDHEIVFQSLSAGAKAYVVKDVESSELKRAIRAVARGESLIDPKVAGHVIDWASRLRTSGLESLRPTELSVLQLLARGSSNKEIAGITGLTLETVRTYVKDIYRKLGVRTRAEAVAIAHRRGVL